MSSRTQRKQAARVAQVPLARARRRHRTAWVWAVAGVVLLLAGLVGYGVYSAQRPKEGFAVPATATADRAGLQVGDGPVTVEIYLDYLCPACRTFEEAAEPILDKQLDDGRITVIYHPVAILDRYSTNEYSSRTAAGAGCAADAGRLREYTSALYARQPAEGGPGHTDDELVQVVSAAGVPGDEFGACLRSDRYADWVAHVTAAMSSRGVNATPTVFVNGRKLANPTQELARAITAA